MVVTILFYIFAVITVVGALSVITARNPVRAVLSLVITFVSAAALWMLLNVEFLALALVVIYVGAVMVLFLFVVMMLNIKMATRKASFVVYWPLALIIGILLVVLLCNYVGPHHFGLKLYPAPPAAPANYSNITQLGMVLYTDYIFPFELAAVLLLAAMISAIALTHRGKRLGTKTQKPSEQVKVKASDRLRVIAMKSEPKGDR